MLRRNYYRNVFIGLGISISVLVLALLFPYIIDILKPSPDFMEQTQVVDVNLLPPPPGALELEYVRPTVLPPPENAVPVVTKDTVVEKKKIVEKEKPKDDDKTTVDTSSHSTAGGGQPGGTGSSNEIFWDVQQPARPPYNWKEYLAKNVKYPEIDKRMNVQGKVMVTVKFNVDGTVADAYISRSVSKTLDAEALRIIKSMPAWQPGIRNGKPVAMFLIVPFNFTFIR